MKYALWLGSLLVVFGCSSKKDYHPYKYPEPVPLVEPEIINKPSTPAIPDPISRIHLKRNRTFEETWARSLNAIKERKYGTTLVDERQGIIYTDWVYLTEEVCEQYVTEKTPLDCRVRYFIDIEKLTRRASTFSIRYSEECELPTKTDFRCPNSNAELIMRSIATEVDTDS